MRRLSGCVGCQTGGDAGTDSRRKTTVAANCFDTVQIDRTFRRAGAIEGRTGCRSIERSCGLEERELQAGKIEDEDENEDEEEDLSMDPIKTQIVVVGAGPGG